MFELADRLVGIYKTHDATKSVTINPRMFSEATAIKGKMLASASRERDRRIAGLSGVEEGEEEGEGEEGVRGIERGSEKKVLGDATNRMN